MNIMREKIGNFSREIKTIKTNQIKICLEKSIPKMKNSLNGLNSKFDTEDQ